MVNSDELRKNLKVWCWWKSRYLWYTGRVIDGMYEFIDIADEITMISEKELAALEIYK